MSYVSPDKNLETSDIPQHASGIRFPVAKPVGKVGHIQKDGTSVSTVNDFLQSYSGSQFSVSQSPGTACQPAPSHPQGPQPTSPYNSNNCLQPGCSFFGTMEFGGYCSKCFMNKTIDEIGRSPASKKVGKLFCLRSLFSSNMG